MTALSANIVLFMQVTIVLLGLVLLACTLGLIWRASQGRVRVASGRVDDVELGERATLLQLSSEMCTPCRATARVLGGLNSPEIRHVEVDIVDRPDLVARFNVLQTPTTFILDAEGSVLARIGGAVRRETVIAELDRVLAVA
jgi:thiol-disulfide isomerase/thioredoxin